MTPEERAEKIQAHCLGMGGICSGPEVIAIIAAQISEAEREAISRPWDDIDRIYKQGYTEGFASAREKAAGISLRHFEETEYHDDTTCDCGGVIAERIRAMEAGK